MRDRRIVEVITDGVNGLLSEPGNPADLTAKIEWIISDESYGNIIGKAARDLTIEKFSKEKMIEETINVYEKSLK